jgi:cell division cycle 14
LRGLDYAIKLGWFDIKTFNLRDYEFYEKVENGDLNWIIPDKFIAFSGPSKTPRDADGVSLFYLILRIEHLLQKIIFQYLNNLMFKL